MIEAMLPTSVSSGGAILPGPQELATGNSTVGYYGQVTTSQLIRSDDLATLCGLTAGSAIYQNDGWLKVSWQGKVQYLSKMPMRHLLTWNDLNAKDLVTGKLVTIKGVLYKVRLMKGCNVDPYPLDADNPNGGEYSIGSEWNMLMYGLMSAIAASYLEGPALATFAQADLGLSPLGGGTCPYVQERGNGNMAMLRTDGSGGIRYLSRMDRDVTDVYRGWRPVLEHMPT